MNKSFLLMIIVACCVFFANLGGLSINILDEAKNSTAAKEMFVNHEPIVPTFNNELRTDKPPLHYYFMMAAYSMFGINEFSARFCSALFGFLTIVVTFFFVKKYVNEKAAYVTALTLLSSIQIAVQFRMAVPDPFLIFFFVLSVMLFYAWFTHKSVFYLVSSYVCVGIAVLAKGPVAIVLYSAIVLAFLASQRTISWKKIWELRPELGLIIVFAIAAPWYVLVHLKTNGAWTEGFFLKHNVSRFVAPMEGHGGSFLKILLFAILGLFPASIFLPQTIKWIWKQNKPNPFLTICWISATIVLVFFCFSQTKLPNYVSPSLPFIAILLSTFISERKSSKGLAVSIWTYAIITVAISIAVPIVLEDVLNLPIIRYQGLWFLVLPIGALLAILYLNREQPIAAFHSLAASWIVLIMVFFIQVYPAIDGQTPVVKMLKMINDRNTAVYYAEKYNPSFSFYMLHPIKSIDSVNGSDLQKPFYILCSKRNLEAKDPLLNQFQVMYQSRELFEPYYSILLYHDAAVSTLP